MNFRKLFLLTFCLLIVTSPVFGESLAVDSQSPTINFNEIPPGDLSSSSTISETVDLAAQFGIATPAGMEWSNNGKDLYIGDNNDNSVVHLTASTAYDITTLKSASDTYFPSVDDVGAVYVHSSGDTLYIGDRGPSYELKQYALPTSYQISNASLDGSLTATTDQGVFNGLDFNDTGTKMLSGAVFEDEVSSWSMTEPYDITTGSFIQSNTTVDLQSPRDVVFYSDGQKVIVATNNGILDIVLGSPYSITSMTQEDYFVVNELGRPNGLDMNATEGVIFEADASEGELHTIDIRQ